MRELLASDLRERERESFREREGRFRERKGGEWFTEIVESR